MQNFTSAPLTTDFEMTGHAVISLQVSTSEPDAAIFVYLSEIEADGTGIQRASDQRDEAGSGR